MAPARSTPLAVPVLRPRRKNTRTRSTSAPRPGRSAQAQATAAALELCRPALLDHPEPHLVPLVYLLDIGAGTFKRVAEGREEFADLADVPKNGNDWLMIPLVDQCVAAGIRLGPRQCYGFKIPPLLGGEYAVHNVAPVDPLSVKSGLGPLPGVRGALCYLPGNQLSYS